MELRIHITEHGVAVVGAVEVGELQGQFEVVPSLFLALRVESFGIPLVGLVRLLCPFESMTESPVVAVFAHAEGVDVLISREVFGPFGECRIGGLINEHGYVVGHHRIGQVERRGEVDQHVIGANGDREHLLGVPAPLLESGAHALCLGTTGNELPLDIEEVIVWFGHMVIIMREPEKGCIMAEQELLMRFYLRVDKGDTCAQSFGDIVRVMPYVCCRESECVCHLRDAQEHQMHVFGIIGRRMRMAVEGRVAVMVDEHALCPTLRGVHHRQVYLLGQGSGLQLHDTQCTQMVAEQVAVDYVGSLGSQLLDEREAEDVLRVMILLVGFAEDEHALRPLGIDGEQLLALGAMTVENDQAAAQRVTLQLCQEPFAHLFSILFGKYDDGLMIVLVALSDDRIDQHVVCAEEERMVRETVTQQSATESRSAVLDDVTEQRDEQAGDEDEPYEVNDDLIGKVVVTMLHKLTGRKDELDNLPDGEMHSEGRADAPEQGHQYADDKRHVHDLPSLSLTQQTVYAIEKPVHRRNRIVVRFVPLSMI